MRPARPYFESHAARESLWVWDPCFKEIIRAKSSVTKLVRRYKTEKISLNWYRGWKFDFKQNFKKKLKDKISWARYLSRLKFFGHFVLLTLKVMLIFFSQSIENYDRPGGST